MQDPAPVASSTPASVSSPPAGRSGADTANRRDRIRLWLISLLLVGLTWGVFAQTLRFGFVDLDDGVYVVQNPYVRGLSGDGLAWAWTSSRAAANWHPLTWMSLQLDAQLFGPGPAGFHATNVLLHTLNVLLLFACLRGATGRFWPSAMVAALFAIHPLHVESVAWISERKDVLSTLFGLAAIWAYLQHVRRSEPGWMFLTGLLLILSLLSKQMLVTLPCILLLLDYWPLARLAELPPRERWRTLVREKAGLFVVVAIFCLIALVAQQSGSAMQSLVKFSLPVRLGNALVAYAAYLGQMVWPTRLVVFYPHPGSSLSLVPVALATLVLAAISWLAWTQRQSRPYLLFGWLWYLGTLVPVIGLVQVGEQQMADRYTYVPLIGLFVAIVWGVARWADQRRWRPAVVTLCAVALVALTVLAFRQTQVWQNSLTLFGHAVAKSPRNPFCENSLGLALEQAGDPAAAQAHYERSLEIDPKSVASLQNLASLLQQDPANLPRVRELLERALAIDPGNAQTHSLMAGLFVVEGDADKAVEYYEHAISLAPYDTTPRENLAAVLRALGKSDEALAQLKEWQRIAPEDPRVYNSLAATMVDLERPGEAESLYLKALRLDPKYVIARSNLGILKHRMGEFDAAVEHFRVAHRMAPANREVIENLSGALVNAGVEAAKQERSMDAKMLLDEAISLTPRSFFAHHRMARVAVDNGFRDEARRHFEAALAPDADLRRVKSGDLAMCHYDLGLMLAVQDDFEGAAPHFAAALELVPEFTAAKGALERTERLREQKQEALKSGAAEPVSP